MAKKKAKAKVRRVLLLPSGKQYEITGEDGIYWYCGGTQFFKRLGYAVTEAATEAEPEQEPEAAETAE